MTDIKDLEKTGIFYRALFALKCGFHEWGLHTDNMYQYVLLSLSYAPTLFLYIDF